MQHQCLRTPYVTFESDTHARLLLLTGRSITRLATPFSCPVLNNSSNVKHTSVFLGMDIADAHAAAGGGSAAVGTTADAQTGKSLLDAFSFWSCSPSFDHRSSYSEGAVKKEGLIDPLGLSSFGAIEEDEMEIGETPSLEISGHESNPSNGFQNGLGGEYFAEASGDFGGSASAGVDVGWMQQPKVELQTTARKQCWDDGGFSLQELSGTCSQI